ncbi:hypothetical protein MBRA1_002438 [Malassezia brasiliensis]|uniref:Membrane-associated protein n=1 Tax=Malassezia brasiliensis TaxID=1821822 RepID=A0AAF0DXG5_9BASI|nr:hypothetical protein MBRA1_002438 [Malassezia brasiliensis]
MAFLSLVAPPVLHLVALLLVLITLLSPVPYHSSSISLVYISPVLAPTSNASSPEALALTSSASASSALNSTPALPAPTRAESSADTVQPDSFSMARSLYSLSADPTEPISGTTSASPASSSHTRSDTTDTVSTVALPPDSHPFPTSTPGPARRHLRKRDDPVDTSTMPISNIRFTVGLLGSCFTDTNSTYHCTGSSLQPTFNNTWLATSPGLHTDTSGMLTRITAGPVFVLLSLLVLIVCSALQARRVHREACKATCTLPARRTLFVLQCCTYAQDVAALVLFIVMICLRIQVSHANDAFNAANGQRTLGEAALSQPGMLPTQLILSANVGTAFSCVCVSAVIFVGLARWERRRLRRETPLEGKEESCTTQRPTWKRFLRAPLTEMTQPQRRSVTISAPLPIYTPDHVPQRHEAWMTVEGRKIRPYPRVP